MAGFMWGSFLRTLGFALAESADAKRKCKTCAKSAKIGGRGGFFEATFLGFSRATNGKRHHLRLADLTQIRSPFGGSGKWSERSPVPPHLHFLKGRNGVFSFGGGGGKTHHSGQGAGDWRWFCAGCWVLVRVPVVVRHCSQISNALWGLCWFLWVYC